MDQNRRLKPADQNLGPEGMEGKMGVDRETIKQRRLKGREVQREGNQAGKKDFERTLTVPI